MDLYSLGGAGAAYQPSDTAITSRPYGTGVSSRFLEEAAAVLSVEIIQLPSPARAASPREPLAWKGPPFKTLAKTEPMQLISLVGNSALADHDLTFAAEALGFVENEPAAIITLLEWLGNHKSPIVREGVVYGLARHARTLKNARLLLEWMAQKDASPEVRAAAAEALED